jgi:hypothetical protein
MTALFARKANDTDAAISSTMSALPIPAPDSFGEKDAAGKGTLTHHLYKK